MARKEILDLFEKYVDPFRVTKGEGVRLKDFDRGDTCGLRLEKGEGAEPLARHCLARRGAGNALCRGPPFALAAAHGQASADSMLRINQAFSRLLDGSGNALMMTTPRTAAASLVRHQR